MNIFIPGGAGFIGTNFVRWILKKHPDYKIINFDKLAYASSIQNLRGVKKEENHIFVKGDICNKKSLQDVFSRYGIDNVVNFAAETHVDRSILNPAVFLNSNIKGVQTLLEVSRKFGIKKFIQVSTDEVYGSSGKNESFTEESLLKPNNPYSASKASADLICRAYFKTYNFPVTIVRSSNNYGPYQFPEKLIPLIIYNSLHNKKIPIYGDGRNIRDWLYVEDNCKAIDLLLHKGENGEIYNVSGGNEKENIEVVKLLIKKLGKSEDLIQYVKDRLAHDRRYAMDSTKIKRELSWQPAHQFKEGIEKTIKWYLNNIEWLKNCISKKYHSYYQQIYGA